MHIYMATGKSAGSKPHAHTVTGTLPLRRRLFASLGEQLEAYELILTAFSFLLEPQHTKLTKVRHHHVHALLEPLELRLKRGEALPHHRALLRLSPRNLGHNLLHRGAKLGTYQLGVHCAEAFHQSPAHGCGRHEATATTPSATTPSASAGATSYSTLAMRPRSEGAGCEFQLSAPAATYAPLSMWARPRRGRGFLFVPLKDLVDEVYSVYFHVATVRE